MAEGKLDFGEPLRACGADSEKLCDCGQIWATGKGWDVHIATMARCTDELSAFEYIDPDLRGPVSQRVVETYNALAGIPSPAEFVAAALGALETWRLTTYVNGQLTQESADDMEKAMVRLRAAAPNQKES